jgi:ADP-ribosylglycohydrolase
MVHHATIVRDALQTSSVVALVHSHNLALAAASATASAIVDPRRAGRLLAAIPSLFRGSVRSRRIFLASR